MTAAVATPARSLLDQVHDHMPGWAEVSAAINSVLAQTRSLTLPTLLMSSVAELAAAAREGKPLPDDLGQRHVTDQATAAAAKATREWHTAVLEQLRMELADLERVHADEALRFLDEELRDLIAGARAALVEMGSVRTGEAAARAGETLRAAWIAFDDSVDSLRVLRSVQHGVVLAAVGSQDVARSLLRYGGEVANLAEILPDWQAIQRRERNGSMVLGYDTGSPYVEPPWRYDRSDEPLIPSVDRDYLTWLCESGAQPRVLTVQQMQDVVDELLRRPLDEDAQRRLKAQRRQEQAADRVEVRVRSHRQHAEDQAEAHSHHGGTA